MVQTAAEIVLERFSRPTLRTTRTVIAPLVAAARTHPAGVPGGRGQGADIGVLVKATPLSWTLIRPSISFDWIPRDNLLKSLARRAAAPADSAHSGSCNGAERL